MANELIPWATGLGANVLTNAEYGTLTERQQGAQSGIANPQSFNAAMRQATFAAAMVGEFTSTYSGSDVKDDGNVGVFMENFVQAILNVVNTPVFGIDNGSANHVVLARTSPKITHVKFGTTVYAQISNANTGNADITVNGNGPFPIIRSSGAGLVANDIVAGGVAHMFFDGWQFQLLNWQDPGGVGSGGTTAPPPPPPVANLQLAGRLPVFGSGRWVLIRFDGYLEIVDGQFYTGAWLNHSEIQWKVPAGVTSIRVRDLGAGGGGKPGQKTGGTAQGGGGGEFAYGVFPVTPGETYLAYPGAPGRGGFTEHFLSLEGGATTGPYMASSSGEASYFKLSGGATLITANGGMSGDLGGAGGTGGTGGSFRAAGGSGSLLGGGGGAGSQAGQGGAGGKGGGGIGASAYGGPDGGGGSLWGPGDGTGQGKGGIDWQGAVAGRSAFKDGVSPAYCMDFFPGGGGNANGSGFTVTQQNIISNSSNAALRSLPISIVGGQTGSIGGGGGAGLAPSGNFQTSTTAATGAFAVGGNGGCGGGGGGVHMGSWANIQSGDSQSEPNIGLRRQPFVPDTEAGLFHGWLPCGGGHGGIGGGGGGGGPASGFGGPGMILIEW